MATSGRTENTSLIRLQIEERLFAHPYDFEFVQAVRLLRHLYKNRADVGTFQPPKTEVVRFAAHASLSFPASQLQELERTEDGPPVMRVNFMGLVGPLGALPVYYTELVANRAGPQHRDRTLRDFLDLFNHRLISLHYQAWLKYRFFVRFEQGEDDAFSQYLLDLIGLGTPGLKNRQAVQDQSLLYFAGLFAQHPRSAEGLRLILKDYFGAPFEVQQFLGAWYRLGPEAQCNLEDDTLDSQQLGFGAVVGDEIWDPQARIRIVIGPVPLKQYLDFLPSGTAYEPLRALVRFFAGDEFDFEAQLILRREEVPACELGATGEASPQLGWLSWSKSRPMDRHPSETILQL